MTALAIASPLPQFFDLAGEPLTGGSLYFGSVDANPETSPVPVYWDAELTQPAAQPIKTVNGYAQRAGTASVVYAANDYSMMVKDRLGRQVLYLRDSAEGNAASAVNAFRAEIASTATGDGAAMIGSEDAGGYWAGTNQEAINQEAGRYLRGRLRDIRTFSGIVADNVTDDRAAFQAAVITARDSGCGIWFPPGVKLRLEFSNANHFIFVNGAVNWVGGDRFSCGFTIHCTENLISNTNPIINAGHDPIFCWGITAVGSSVSKVKGAVRGIGTWITSTCGRFERMNHVYGATDFTVEDCYADFTAKTWPASDAAHTFGYQAGGWWSSNVQPTMATGQTRDRNIKFIRNVGFASAEYQNAESIALTRVDGIQYLNNYLSGWGDDMAFHECAYGLMQGNYYAAVSGRYYADNSQHIKILGNTIKAIPRPIAGGYLGPTRTYISINMATQYAAILNDDPNEDILIADNTVILDTNSYCSGAVYCYGVQDGLTIRDNAIWNWGALTPVTCIAASTLYRAGWTGPSWNPDFAAGGAIKMRSVEISGNRELGSGWITNEGNIAVLTYAGGSTADVIGPVVIENNTAGGYYVTHETVRLGKNYAIAAGTDAYKNVSLVALWDSPPVWVGKVPASAAVNNANFPQAAPTFYTPIDDDGLKFIAQRAGRVIGAHLQLTANMTAGNNAVLRIMKNGVQIGTDTDSSTNSPTTNPSRYVWNFFGVANMTFAEGDLIECLLTIRLAQGATAIVGRINLVAVYS